MILNILTLPDYASEIFQKPTTYWDYDNEHGRFLLKEPRFHCWARDFSGHVFINIFRLLILFINS